MKDILIACGIAFGLVAFWCLCIFGAIVGLAIESAWLFGGSIFSSFASIEIVDFLNSGSEHPSYREHPAYRRYRRENP